MPKLKPDTIIPDAAEDAAITAAALADHDARPFRSGYLIDPDARTITPVALEPHDDDLDALVAQYHRLLGVKLSARVPLRNGDILYVDDLGLLKDPAQMFWLAGAATPLAGRALLHGVRHDDFGEECIDDARTSLAELTAQVRFFAVADEPQVAAWVAQVAEDAKAQMAALGGAFVP